ncbi:carbamoyltransferase HypF [Methanolacinia petrolearia]|uniref:carbamoyltransferase HypF n=1 Tax=Methanolacinia petrolearia TaxID=54120 RepID=UPI003BA875BF
MRKSGQIIIRGIVQGVGFRPFVYSEAEKCGIRGSVKNLGSEVRIIASGDHFDEFLKSVSKGTVLSRIDSVELLDLEENADHHPRDFRIVESGTGELTGFIPPDVAICDECVKDIFEKEGRYENYWATSCVNCGPRYSIIREIPYDRERTTMEEFPCCPECKREYSSPRSRRHHAQTIACEKCGPELELLDKNGKSVDISDPIRNTAELLDKGRILAIRGIGGYHLVCVENSASRLKKCLGRTEQPLAVMGLRDTIEDVCDVSTEEKEILSGPEHPIMVLYKKDPASHSDISNLNTLGCMLPYTGFHHLLFSHLKNPLLIMTSANSPGNPMITETGEAVDKLSNCVDYFLSHNRHIQNRCDDSVVREGYIIRLSRGYAPKRIGINLGSTVILGVGPELNSNATIYKKGFTYTSPHVGNVRNPPTLDYLRETVEKMERIIGAEYDFIAHDLHPQFLSTRYAKEIAESKGLETVAVQHHRAHIAAVTTEPCIGIAIDGVGYGDDGKIWGGEIFAGEITDLKRVGHLETVLMPGGDLATRFPGRMLYGIMQSDEVLELLSARGWGDIELGVLQKQVERRFNVAETSSTGRVLDAASALLDICRERTYDGEPAMKLESVASAGRCESWDLEYTSDEAGTVLSTRSLLETALEKMKTMKTAEIAASFQYNLARGVAHMAVGAAEKYGLENVAISGGVAYNHNIRTTIIDELEKHNLRPLLNSELPLGDGCISFGQCVCAGLMMR